MFQSALRSLVLAEALGNYTAGASERAPVLCKCAVQDTDCGGWSRAAGETLQNEEKQLRRHADSQE